MSDEYYSQSHVGQDKFVCETLNFKRDGTFLDVGCYYHDAINNTYYMEKNLNWRGIAIDVEETYKDGWIKNRKNSVFVCADACKLDYAELLAANNMPKIIDYLSLDLEPPQATLDALFKIFQADYSFNVVTFEVDSYRCQVTQEPSRQLLTSFGFVCVKENVSNVDDFYVHERLLIKNP